MKRFFVALLCLVAVAVAGPASAATLGLDYLIGTLLSAEPSNPATELGYANNLITWYNGGANPGGSYALAVQPGMGSLVPDAPLDPATGGVQVPAVNGVLSAPVDLTGYTYLWAKFGQDGALYFLNGSVTSLTGFVPAYGPFDAQGGGLSHVTLFGPGTTTRVPEAGALLLFGSGLIGLVGYRRVRRMQ